MVRARFSSRSFLVPHPAEKMDKLINIIFSMKIKHKAYKPLCNQQAFFEVEHSFLKCHQSIKHLRLSSILFHILQKYLISKVQKSKIRLRNNTTND